MSKFIMTEEQKHLENGKVKRDMLIDMVEANPSVGFRRHEEQAERTQSALQLVKKSREDLWEELEKMKAISEEFETKIKKISSKTKDQTEQMKNILNKVNTILGGDFESRINQLERFSTAINNLYSLDAEKLKLILDILGSKK